MPVSKPIEHAHLLILACVLGLAAARVSGAVHAAETASLGYLAKGNPLGLGFAPRCKAPVSMLPPSSAIYGAPPAFVAEYISPVAELAPPRALAEVSAADRMLAIASASAGDVDHPQLREARAEFKPIQAKSLVRFFAAVKPANVESPMTSR
ncbi:MAG: hypothetical protein EXS30_10280 [Pedosphaera sp.]|nr:hypothetical protein [Pedosphaera sp.]